MSQYFSKMHFLTEQNVLQVVEKQGKSVIKHQYNF